MNMNGGIVMGSYSWVKDRAKVLHSINFTEIINIKI